MRCRLLCAGSWKETTSANLLLQKERPRLRARSRESPCFPGAAHPCSSDLMFRLTGAFIRSASVRFVPAPYNYGAHRSCEDYRPLCRPLATQNIALLTENKRTICPPRSDAVLFNEAVARPSPRGGPRRSPIITSRAVYRTTPHASRSQPSSVHDFRVLSYRAIVAEPY